MKKVFFTLVIVSMFIATSLVSVSEASARAGFLGSSYKPAVSWQVYSVESNILTVHESVEYSPICFQGGAEWYDGSCTEGGTPTSQYMQRMRAE